MSCYIYLITDLPYWILVTLLNLYSQTSLISQGYKTFPFKVLSSLKDLKRKLKSLGEKWVWPENYLDLTSIGSPKDIVDRLLVCEYSPLPTEGVVQTINRRQCIANQAKSVIFTSLMETGLSDAQLEHLRVSSHQRSLSRCCQWCWEDFLWHFPETWECCWIQKLWQWDCGNTKSEAAIFRLDGKRKLSQDCQATHNHLNSKLLSDAHSGDYCS